MSSMQETSKATKVRDEDAMVVTWPEAGLAGRTSWRPTRIECTIAGEKKTVAEGLEYLLRGVEEHADAWPFRTPVQGVPDYDAVLARHDKEPLDLSAVRQRVNSGRHYANIEGLLADICRICENCRLYNGESNQYATCATNIEIYARSRFAEISSHRVQQNS